MRLPIGREFKTEQLRSSLPCLSESVSEQVARNDKDFDFQRNNQFYYY
jgi:hypothetical protein